MANGNQGTAGGGSDMRLPTLGAPTSKPGSNGGTPSAATSPIFSRLPGRFTPELQRVSRDLDLPDAAKREILEELADDLVSLSARFRAQGHTAGEADRLALERLRLSDASSSALIHLHSTPLERFLRGSVRFARTGRDLALIFGAMALLVGSVVIVGGRAGMTAALGAVWPLALLSMLSLWSLRGAWRTIGAPTLDISCAHAHLTGLLVLCMLAVPTATLLAALRFHREARAYSRAGADPSAGLLALLGECSMVLALGLVFALTIAAAWSLAAGRLGRRIRAEAPASAIFPTPSRS